ncbi:MAG: hypothetical protein EWV85_05590 [Microcystis aeruginosa Ma_QC_C_20070703_M131]|uniref:HNH endonuclease n=1 Tax=Microcystis aeruginosa Ma_QC_C_20070703_M131 TaxID=2486263 RepID=A0A551YDI2_MICAE|nr:MAG: hypothetical protein EWV85_05590 [Microcystis aeruginosa Ma_QC_C_20070703_M131]
MIDKAFRNQHRLSSKKQNGKCNSCGQYFTPSDRIEVDHIPTPNPTNKLFQPTLNKLHKLSRKNR